MMDSIILHSFSNQMSFGFFFFFFFFLRYLAQGFNMISIQIDETVLVDEYTPQPLYNPVVGIQSRSPVG